MSGSMARIAAALGWRQKYENKSQYLLELNSGTTLEFDQIPNGETSGVGTGAHVWPAAHVLSKYLEKRGGLAGATVVDLGSGTGVCSVVAGALGAAVSVATDVESTAALMRANCLRATEQLGLAEDCLRVATFDWAGSADHLPSPDMVLVSDCILPQLYEIEPLVLALKTLLGKKAGSVAIVSYEHRPYPHYHPRSRFDELLQKHGLCIARTIPQAEQHDVYVSDEVELLEVRAKEAAAQGAGPGAAQAPAQEGKKSTSISVMSANEAAAFIAAREAEAAEEFRSAVEDWRVSKAQGGGAAVIAESGGCFNGAVASVATPNPASAPASVRPSANSAELPVCPSCGTNTAVIKCVRGKPGPELYARSQRGEVKLTGCTTSEKGWCTVCQAYV
jgi:predicted nicotinamide N-methyase